MGEFLRLRVLYPALQHDLDRSDSFKFKADGWKADLNVCLFHEVLVFQTEAVGNSSPKETYNFRLFIHHNVFRAIYRTSDEPLCGQGESTYLHSGSHKLRI